MTATTHLDVSPLPASTLPGSAPAVAAPTAPTRTASLRQVTNPPNPWHTAEIDWLGKPPDAHLEVFTDQSRAILSRNTSPDLGFDWSVNPYRGCYHGCAYCYARPSHQYLDFGAGTDFERRLVVKPKAPRLLAEAFDRRTWRGEVIVFSGNTDCYQPLEAAWQLTRQCLEVCIDYRQPISIITRSTLIERDIELLVELSRVASVHINLSIPFIDDAMARALEPYAPKPSRRLKTLARLSAAGLTVGVMVAPIIPGLTDDQIPEILTRSHEAGARYSGRTLLRLPPPVDAVFERRLREAFPDRAERVLRQLEACRDGSGNDSRFGHRMRGQGPRWAAIDGLWKTWHRKLGFSGAPARPDPTTFRRPQSTQQLPLL